MARAEETRLHAGRISLTGGLVEPETEPPEQKAMRAKLALEASQAAMKAANDAESALIRAQERELDLREASEAADQAAAAAESAVQRAMEAEEAAARDGRQR